jgi:hypothetical protein
LTKTLASALCSTSPSNSTGTGESKSISLRGTRTSRLYTTAAADENPGNLQLP